MLFANLDCFRNLPWYNESHVGLPSERILCQETPDLWLGGWFLNETETSWDRQTKEVEEALAGKLGCGYFFPWTWSIGDHLAAGHQNLTPMMQLWLGARLSEGGEIVATFLALSQVEVAMGHTGTPSHLTPKSPKVWSTGGMPRRINIVLGPLTLALIILTLFVILSLLILDLTFLWHPKLTLENVVSRQPDKHAILSPGCDLFTGSWVYDGTYPLYSNCTFVEQGFRCSENGRPDSQYRKWRWQPSNCIMPRLDPTSHVAPCIIL